MWRTHEPTVPSGVWPLGYIHIHTWQQRAGTWGPIPCLSWNSEMLLYYQNDLTLGIVNTSTKCSLSGGMSIVEVALALMATCPRRWHKSLRKIKQKRLHIFHFLRSATSICSDLCWGLYFWTWKHGTCNLKSVSIQIWLCLLYYKSKIWKPKAFISAWGKPAVLISCRSLGSKHRDTCFP